MTTTRHHARPGVWLTPDDCDLDDFRSLVERTTDPADHPLADDVRQNVPVYGDRLRRRAGTPEGRREAQAELVRTLADGPGIVVIAGAFDDRGRRPRHRRLRGDDRGPEGVRRRVPATTSPGRAPTTGCGARWTSSPSATRRRSPPTTRTTSSRSSARRGSGGLPGDVPGQRRQPGRCGPGAAPRLPPRLHVAGAARAPTRRRSIASRRTSRCRARSPTATCRSRPARRCTCRTRRSTSRATWPSTARSSRGTSRSTTSSSRCARATRSSSTRRCSTAPARTGPPTSGGRRTCCRSPPHSAAPWRPSTVRR